MSAHHETIRRGSNQIIGMRNEEVMWKITPVGFLFSAPLWSQSVYIDGIGLSPIIEIYKIGKIIYLYFPLILTQTVANGNHIGTAVGAIPAEFRPANSVPFPCTVVSASRLGGLNAVARLDPNGQILFWFLDINGGKIQAFTETPGITAAIDGFTMIYTIS
jgi:hypothetical protein